MGHPSIPVLRPYLFLLLPRSSLGEYEPMMLGRFSALHVRFAETDEDRDETTGLGATCKELLFLEELASSRQ